MDHYSEEIIIHFTSYAPTPFKAEIYADSLTIDWGQGPVSFQSESNYFNLTHHYQTNGKQEIRITGDNITYLDISRLNLTEIKLNNCLYLEYLNCSVNELFKVDLKQCPALEELLCNSNNIHSLDLSMNPGLTTLNISCNTLEQLNLSSCQALKTIYCIDNQLRTLDISSCNNLCYLDISNNLFDTVQLDNLFGQLPASRKEDHSTICYMENRGSECCNKEILKEKGWS